MKRMMISLVSKRVQLMPFSAWKLAVCGYIACLDSQIYSLVFWMIPAFKHKPRGQQFVQRHEIEVAHISFKQPSWLQSNDLQRKKMLLGNPPCGAEWCLFSGGKKVNQANDQIQAKLPSTKDSSNSQDPGLYQNFSHQKHSVHIQRSVILSIVYGDIISTFWLASYSSLRRSSSCD